ncbi:unnamed protein product, partial [Choristocarpus tenellus]
MVVGMGSGTGQDGSMSSVQGGTRDQKGVRASSGYKTRLPPLSPLSGTGDDREEGLLGGGGGDGIAVGAGGVLDLDGVLDSTLLGAGTGGAGGGRGEGGWVGGRNYLTPVPQRQVPLEALLSWVYRGWNVLSLGLLTLAVMMIFDSQRAARLFKQIGLARWAARVGGAGE